MLVKEATGNTSCHGISSASQEIIWSEELFVYFHNAKHAQLGIVFMFKKQWVSGTSERYTDTDKYSVDREFQDMDWPIKMLKSFISDRRIWYKNNGLQADIYYSSTLLFVQFNSRMFRPWPFYHLINWVWLDVWVGRLWYPFSPFRLSLYTLKFYIMQCVHISPNHSEIKITLRVTIV